ncbi:MAG: energy transducer TonB [Prevotella sp.]|nr:energy transducer TonB [Prevotella sp.]
MRKILSVILVLFFCGSVMAKSKTNNSLALDDTLTVLQDGCCAKFPDNLQEYVMKHIQNPPEYAGNTVYGRIDVTFKIHPNGTTSDFKIVRGIDSLIDKEVIRVMKQMPKWIWCSKKRKTIMFMFSVYIFLE